MYKKCRHCGFKNPPEINDCLVCHKDLPTTVGEVKEAWGKLEKLSKGEVGGVAGEVVKDYVGETVSSLKYRFHPLWFLKVRLHRLKMAIIDILWVFGVIGGVVLLGLLYNLIRKALGK